MCNSQFPPKVQELILRANEVVFTSPSTGKVTTKLNLEKLIELVVKECADAADMAYDARCKYPGDYVVEQLGYGTEHGAANFRVEKD